MDAMDVVIVGGGPWSPDINFPIHHTARILSRDHRVLYIYRDSHTSLLGHLTGRLPGFHTGRELVSRVITPRQIKQVDERLWVSPVSGPAALLPLSYPPLARAIDLQLVIRQLRWALGELGFQKPLLWFYWWFFPEIVQAIPHRMAVYDMYDDHTQYDFVRDDPRRQAYTGRLEQTLLHSVDVAFAVSHKLVESKAGGAPVYYLPNGVDIDMAQRAGAMGAPADMEQFHRPIFGYLGSYDSRMNWSLVQEMARARPQWSFVFVGGGAYQPDDPPANLHLLGNRDYSDALRYVSGFDVALIPFVRDALTDAICPAKLFDYLALGRPTVSTPLPAIEEIVGAGSMVYRAQTSQEFVHAGEQALHEPEYLPRERQALARSLTWDRRVARAMEIIATSAGG